MFSTISGTLPNDLAHLFICGRYASAFARARDVVDAEHVFHDGAGRGAIEEPAQEREVYEPHAVVHEQQRRVTVG